VDGPAGGGSSERALDGSDSAVTTSSPIVLASGAITPHDSLRVELHQPIGSPAFILVHWPEAPSITSTAQSAGAHGCARLLASWPQRRQDLPKSDRSNSERATGLGVSRYLIDNRAFNDAAWNGIQG
jgi:hypothetical protein